MPTALLYSLLLQILIVGYTPGPANVYALAMSLRYGRKRSLFMWFGLLIGFTLAVSLMAFMAYGLGVAFAKYMLYLKYLGAAYILYLSYKTWKSKNGLDEDSGDCSLLSGMLVQLTNVKMLLFDLTIFSTFVLPYSHRLTDLFQVAAWLLLAGPGANLVWLLAGSYLRRFFIGYQRQVAVICACALALCAAYVALV